MFSIHGRYFIRIRAARMQFPSGGEPGTRGRRANGSERGQSTAFHTAVGRDLGSKDRPALRTDWRMRQSSPTRVSGREGAGDSETVPPGGPSRRRRIRVKANGPNTFFRVLRFFSRRIYGVPFFTSRLMLLYVVCSMQGRRPRASAPPFSCENRPAGVIIETKLI